MLQHCSEERLQPQSCRAITTMRGFALTSPAGVNTPIILQPNSTHGLASICVLRAITLGEASPCAVGLDALDGTALKG